MTNYDILSWWCLPFRHGLSIPTWGWRTRNSSESTLHILRTPNNTSFSMSFLLIFFFFLVGNPFFSVFFHEDLLGFLHKNYFLFKSSYHFSQNLFSLWIGDIFYSTVCWIVRVFVGTTDRVKLCKMTWTGSPTNVLYIASLGALLTSLSLTVSQSLNSQLLLFGSPWLGFFECLLDCKASTDHRSLPSSGELPISRKV